MTGVNIAGNFTLGPVFASPSFSPFEAGILTEAGCKVHCKPNLLGRVDPQLPGMQMPNEYPSPPRMRQGDLLSAQFPLAADLAGARRTFPPSPSSPSGLSYPVPQPVHLPGTATTATRYTRREG